MNHVSSAILNRIRLCLLGYSILLLGSYGAVVFWLHYGRNGGYGLTPFLAGFIAIQLIYEILAQFVFVKQSPLVRACITLVGVWAQTLMIMEATGVYKSPMMAIVIGLVFLAGAMGLYLATGMVTMLCVGFLLGLGGFFATPTDAPFGVALIIVSSTLVFLGQLFWRKYYIDKDVATDTLSSSLSKEQAKSDIILNAIEDGVILVDTNQIIRLFNPGASAITGWPAEEAVGLDHHAVLHLIDEKNVDYPASQNPFNRVFADHKSVRDSQAVLVSRSNKHISLNLSVSPLIGSTGAISGAVCVFRDVSQERSEEKRRAEFISTASHEMRTPVAAIEGYLALALNPRVSTVDTKARQFLEKAHSSTQHLGKLFQDLLTSAKAEDGRLSSHPTALEMGEFTEQLVGDLKFSADKKGLRIEFVTGTGNEVIDASNDSAGSSKVIKPLYYVFADPERLREVLINLFDNAVKYTDTGTISVGLTGDEKVVQIYVHDTGPGIPPEDASHLFQKFYRVDNSATRTIGGTGLGLFICRKIIELYNGRIWVESEVGKGSTFFIDLPRIDSKKAAEFAAAETAQGNPTKL
jgi:PAS domain S-box-containing protein